MFAWLREEDKRLEQRIYQAMDEVSERDGQLVIEPGESLGDALRRYGWTI